MMTNDRRVLRDRIILIVVLVVLWQLVMTTGLVSRSLLASPYSIVIALSHLVTDGHLVHAFLQTVLAFVVAFAIAAIVGIVIGVTVGYFESAYRIVVPIISAVNAVPKLIFLPVFVLTLGINYEFQVGYASLSAFAPVALTVAGGVRTVSPLLLKAATSLGASRPQLMRRVILPAAWPAVRTGAWYAGEYALLGVVLTELFISPIGIGGTVSNYTAQSRPEDVFAILLALAAVATGVSALLNRRFTQ